jgi:antitoxin HicB
MRTYTYRAQLGSGEKPGIVVVTFLDVPEAITEGNGEADALLQAEDALSLALLSYPLRSLPLPAARTQAGTAVTVPADTAAKLAVLEAFADAGISKSELARRLDRSENEARRILDPMHATKLPMLQLALKALGRRLVVGVEEIASAA